MTKIMSDLAQNRISGLKGAVESFEMFDSNGNCAAGALFHNGPREFEAWFWDFNSAIPRRIQGTLKDCKLRLQLFFERKEREGFVCATEPIPSQPKA